MFELRPLDDLDFTEMQMMVENLQNSAKKQSGAGSKVALIAAAAAVGGAAYILSPAGQRKIRSARTRIASWIAPKDQHPVPMWSEGMDPEELEELAQDLGAKPKKKSSRRMTLEQFRNLGNAEDPAAESV